VPCRAGQLQPLQQGASLPVRQGHDRLVVLPEQVEDQVGGRQLVTQLPYQRRRAGPQAPQDLVELRSAVRVGHDELAVEHDVAGGKGAGQLGQLG
jgi:hypothetical protein